jgi:hypothetical protein
MKPEPALASSTYCLAHPGQEYLVYLPEGQEVEIDLTGVPGAYDVEWFDPNSGAFQRSDPVEGNRTVSLESPFEDGDAAVYLTLR